MALGLALTLGACAGESPFAMLGPKEPEVPAAPPGQYPSFSTPEIARPPTLDATGQAKKETELEALARETQVKGEEAAKETP
ncbi:MAG: hypothetical protein B7Z15_01470 [Rhizobiales bacterium 32-66-8]|nr:MAG: hypothetical protein B7Z15_01470 [Rhizobiales bacterium 32-66-8]